MRRSGRGGGARALKSIRLGDDIVLEDRTVPSAIQFTQANYYVRDPDTALESGTQVEIVAFRTGPTDDSVPSITQRATARQ